MTSNPFPLAQDYHRIMRETYPPPDREASEEFLQGRLRRPQEDFYIHDLPAEQVNERFLHYLWAERLFQTKPFQTTDGTKLQIKHPGLWNQEQGPDFKQAAVYFGNELKEGDIEIHLYSSDWYRHHHQTDPHYNGVILHIVGWQDNEVDFVQTADGKKIPQVILAPFLENQFEEIDQFLEGEFYPKHARFGGQGQCSQFCLNPDLRPGLVSLLEMAGETRLAHKVERFQNRLYQTTTRPPACRGRQVGRSSVQARQPADYNEILYQGIMESLGYYANQANFSELARRLSWTVLSNILSKPLNEPWPLVIQSLLLYQADLVPEKPWGDFDEATRSYLDKTDKIYQAFSKMLGCQKDRPLIWRLKGTRPLNYPYRRIAGASYFFSQMISSNLPDGEAGMIGQLLANRQDLISRLTDYFRPNDSDYWLTHTNFGSKLLKKPVALVGEERVKIIEVNVIIPILVLYAQENNQPDLVQHIIARCKDYPLLSDNYITNFMKYRLFGDKKRPIRETVRTAFSQQGLIQIYRDFCSRGYEGCEYCALLKWLKTKLS